MNLSITTVILLITGFTSYRAFNDRQLFNNLMHYPVAEKRNKEYYRLITSGFIHKDWLHLGINLIVLMSFGELAETLYKSYLGVGLGSIMYILMYLLAIVVADIPSYIKHQNNPGYSAIGASGAVSAVVFVGILFFPWENIELYFFIPIPYIIAGVAYIMYSSWASKNRNDNVGHDAHLYGSLFGFTATIIIFYLFANINVLAYFTQQLLQGPSWLNF